MWEGNAEERFYPSNISSETQATLRLAYPLFNNVLFQVISNKKRTHGLNIIHKVQDCPFIKSFIQYASLQENLPALLSNALNASYSHLVIAIVLLTHSQFLK